MQGDGPQGSAPRRVILIVEDNELNLKLLKDVLDFYGYSTVVTAFGAAALDLARQHHPDLILLDIQLPDIPGEDAARQLKADPQSGVTPEDEAALTNAGIEVEVWISASDRYMHQMKIDMTTSQFTWNVTYHFSSFVAGGGSTST